MSTATQEIQRLQIAQYKCLDSLLFSTRYFFKARFGRKFIVSDHHLIICDALEKVLRGEITKLIINVAPRYTKTELAVKNFIAHGLALNPAAKFIHLTYADKLALDNSEEAKDIVHHESYQALFNVQTKRDSKAKNKWYTDLNGGVYAAAAGGQVTGFGAGKVDEEEEKEFDQSIEEFTSLQAADPSHHIVLKQKFGGAIIIDDPIKPEDAHSEIKRRRVNERFETTIRNRVNSRRTPIIVIGQRVHSKDLSGYLMEVEPGEWTVIKLPCLREDGTALWPLKHTTEELLKLKKINAFVFESQYQQDPKMIKKGGEFYKLFNYAKNVVKNKIVGGKPELYNPSLPLHATYDFNVNPYMTVCLWQLSGKKAIQIDEICLSSPRNMTEEVSKEIMRRYPEHTSGLFIYGDPSGKKEDTRSEKGHNDYIIIKRVLAQYHPSERVFKSAPSVVSRGGFINAVFDGSIEELEILIGDNCLNTIEDYMFLKEDSDGTKLKERVKDPTTEVTFEKYGHCSDANDYFLCWVFAKEFAIYQKGGKSTKISTGGNLSKNTY
jgi:hypothetical protein